MADDPLLKKEEGIKLSEDGDYYQLGLGSLNITEAELRQIGSLMHKLSNIRLDGLRSKKCPEKGTDNDHHRHLQGAVFAFGSENNNQEWREHFSSSIRDMLSLFSDSPDVFTNTLEELVREGKMLQEDFEKINEVCIKIKKYYQFFTGVVHHKPTTIINGFRQLENSEAENRECQTDDNFKLVAKHFFRDMKKIIVMIKSL